MIPTSARLFITNAINTKDLAIPFLASFFVFLLRINHTPFHDELYHVLAAQSLLEDGTFRVADGEYTRASIYTRIVSFALRFGGVSLVAGRLASVLAACALVTLLFHWIRIEGGRRAAFLSCLLFCLCPITILVAQMVRFYTWQALCFSAGAYLASCAVSGKSSIPGRTLFLVAALLNFALAAHFQITTAIGVAALALWAALWLVLRAPLRFNALHWTTLVSGVLAMLAVSFMFFRFQLCNYLLDAFRWQPIGATSPAYDAFFYHRLLIHQYPLLYTLYPVAILTAVRRSPRFGTLAGALFIIPLITHSLAGAKSLRYLFYAMPFFFATWGIALSEWSTPLARGCRAWIIQAFSGVSPAVIPRLVRFLVLALVVWGVLAQPAFPLTARMLLLPDARWDYDAGYRGFADWASAARQLAPIAASATVVSSAGVKSQFYFGHFEYEISRSLRDETDTEQEFGVDQRTGRRVVSEPESLAEIVDQHCWGLVIVEKIHWRTRNGVPEETADFIEEHTLEVPLGGTTHLLAFTWGREADCEP